MTKEIGILIEKMHEIECRYHARFVHHAVRYGGYRGVPLDAPTLVIVKEHTLQDCEASIVVDSRGLFSDPKRR